MLTESEKMPFRRPGPSRFAAVRIYAAPGMLLTNTPFSSGNRARTLPAVSILSVARYKSLKKYTNAAVRYRIELEPLFRDELFLLVRADSPLAGTEEVSFDYLKGMDLAMLAHFNIGENALAFKEHLGSRHYYTTYPNIRLIKKAVLTQNVGAVLSGFAVFCDSSFPLEEFHTIRLLYPGGKSHQFQACLICRDRDNLTPGEAMIKEMVRNQYKGLSISL